MVATMALLVVAFLSERAAAQRTETIEDVIRRGVELRRQRKDAEALEEFQKALEMSASPRVLTQIGWTEQALGRWPDAEAHLQAALKATPDAWVRRMRSTISASLAAVAKHLGSLDVIGTPVGAEVSVDGHVVGSLPLAAPVRVTAGDVVLEVRYLGYRPVSRTVNVRAGQGARETISLVHVLTETEPPAPGATALDKPARGPKDQALATATSAATPAAPDSAASAISPSDGTAPESLAASPAPPIRIGIDGIVNFVGIAGGRVSVPRLWGMRLSGTYAFALPTGFLDVGLLATLTALPYETQTGQSASSSLLGVFVCGRYRDPLSASFSVAGIVAAGVVWWSGLGAGDPFTSEHAGSDGPIPMPSIRLGVEATLNVAGGAYLAAGPSYVFSKTTSSGLTTSVSSISALELSVGAGYTF